MKLKLALTSLLASAAICAAPAFASNGSHGTPTPHIGHVFITPTGCDLEGELYGGYGAFTQWVHISHSHFTGLTVGMTNPDDDEDAFVGQRLDGGTQGVPFGPANTWSITFVPSEDADGFFATIINEPGFGVQIFFGAGSITSNSDGSLTASSTFTGFPTGSAFTGIYLWNFDGVGSFTNTVVDANVDGVEAAPNFHGGSKATNGFVVDCNGIFGAD